MGHSPLLPLDPDPLLPATLRPHAGQPLRLCQARQRPWRAELPHHLPHHPLDRQTAHRTQKLNWNVCPITATATETPALIFWRVFLQTICSRKMSTLFSYFKGQKSGVQAQPGTAACDDAEPVSEPSHPSPHRKRVAPEICEKESVAPVPKKPHGAAETSPQRSSGEARSSLMSDEAGRKAERQRTLAGQNKG